MPHVDDTSPVLLITIVVLALGVVVCAAVAAKLLLFNTPSEDAPAPPQADAAPVAAEEFLSAREECIVDTDNGNGDGGVGTNYVDIAAIGGDDDEKSDTGGRYVQFDGL